MLLRGLLIRIRRIEAARDGVSLLMSFANWWGLISKYVVEVAELVVQQIEFGGEALNLGFGA